MASPLYLLPFDHRESFEHGLFGWSGSLGAEQRAQVADAKRVIYEALLKAIADGVPGDRGAVLVDEEFGRDILLDANARGLVTACPVEKSGQAEFEFQYGEDFARHIESIDPTYCKVLVRYNPQGDAAMNRRQVEKLHRLSKYLHRTKRPFLFELLVPATREQLADVADDALAYDVEVRPALVIQAMRELQDRGVEPDIWKIEGLDRRDDCVAVAETARRGRRDKVTCIVLGRHAEEPRVREWLEVAASVPAFIGFAVGRTTFWKPVQDLIANRISRAEAVTAIARTYQWWVGIWETARKNQTPEVEVYGDADSLVHAEAERVVALAREAVSARGEFSLALSGGSTPRPLYELLATPRFASQVDWSCVHVFWGDERCVPPDHIESNYRMAREALLDHVPIPASNVHRIIGEAQPDDAAAAYEEILRAYFGRRSGPADRTFDLALLGMGDDGHTASLFPGTPAVTEEERWVLASHVTAPRDMWRITLTPVALNAAAAVTFLVAGASKAKRVRDVLEGSARAAPFPAQHIHPRHGALTWMLDAAAAEQLRRET